MLQSSLATTAHHDVLAKGGNLHTLFALTDGKRLSGCSPGSIAVSVRPWHLELIRASREHRGHDEQGSSGVHGADGDDGSLAAHRCTTGRVDCRAVYEDVAAVRRRKQPGVSQLAATGAAATPQCGCSAASAVG